MGSLDVTYRLPERWKPEVNSVKLKARKDRRQKITSPDTSLLGSEVVTTRRFSRKQP